MFHVYDRVTKSPHLVFKEDGSQELTNLELPAILQYFGLLQPRYDSPNNKTKHF